MIRKKLELGGLTILTVEISFDEVCASLFIV
jgi:hypothetical protein